MFILSLLTQKGRSQAKNINLLEINKELKIKNTKSLLKAFKVDFKEKCFAQAKPKKNYCLELNTFPNLKLSLSLILFFNQVIILTNALNEEE